MLTPQPGRAYNGGMTESAAPVTTTLAAWAGKQVTGYDHKPTIDVPVLTPARHCADATCGAAVEYRAKGSWDGGWVHVDGSAGHYVAPRTSCRYCGVEDGQDGAEVKFDATQAWADLTTCSRCGGVTGRALGD
jgi:hypothetical protein